VAEEDPGWPSLGDWLRQAFVPMVRPRRAHEPAGNKLVGMRALYLRFVASPLLFGVVLAILAGSSDRSDGSVDGAIVAAAVVAIGVATLVLARAMERGLDCATDDALARSYRTRFFLRLAFAQTASLAGFVGFFLVGHELWAYVLGALLAVPTSWRAAPTAAHLARDQAILSAGGCGRSLVKALQ
jgi:hypothetical protein